MPKTQNLWEKWHNPYGSKAHALFLSINYSPLKTLEAYSPLTCAIFPTFYHKIQILYKELVPVSGYRRCILLIKLYIYEYNCIFLWYKNEGFSKNLTFWAQRVSTLLSQGVICAIFVSQNRHRNTEIR